MPGIIDPGRFVLRCKSCGYHVQIRVADAIGATGAQLSACPRCNSLAKDTSKRFQRFIKFYQRLAAIDEEATLGISLREVAPFAFDDAHMVVNLTVARFTCIVCGTDFDIGINALHDIRDDPKRFRCPNPRCSGEKSTAKAVKEYFTALIHVIHPPYVHNQWWLLPLSPEPSLPDR